MAANAAPRLSAEQLAELLRLSRGADTVELKVTVPMTDRRGGALGIDPLEAQIRQVYFFDTADLALDRSGVVVRARRIQGREHDTVVKLRPVEPDALPAGLRRSPSFGVEVDAMPGGFVCSGSMKRPLGERDVHESVHGGRPLRKLFSKEQRQLFATYAPHGLELDDLSVLGPIFVLKLKVVPPEYGRKLVAELWLYPDDSTILELSTKCLPGEALQVAAETRAFLTGRGVDLGGEQSTKTRKALELFSRRLRETPATPG